MYKDVCEVFVSENIEDTNALLSDEKSTWRLLLVVPYAKGIRFILGRLRTN